MSGLPLPSDPMELLRQTGETLAHLQQQLAPLAPLALPVLGLAGRMIDGLMRGDDHEPVGDQQLETLRLAAETAQAQYHRALQLRVSTPAAIHRVTP